MNQQREIDATQAHEKMKAGQAILVCAYEQDEKCRDLLLEGAITLTGLRRTLDGRSRGEEIILYGAATDQDAVARAADKLTAQGFTNTRFLVGGVESWKKSGFPLAAEVAEQHPTR